MRKLRIVLVGLALAAAGASVGAVATFPPAGTTDLAADRSGDRIMLDPSADNTDVYT